MKDDNSGTFIEQDVVPGRRVDGECNAFHPDLLRKFQLNLLLFIYSHQELTVVVHFCDYNRPVVSAHLYDMFFSYETFLRELLVRSNISNIDMLRYFEARSASSERSSNFSKKVVTYKKHKSKFTNLPEFQFFYIDDLIGLANHKGVMYLSTTTVALRNHVMHAHGFVNRLDIAAGDFIYTFETFEMFFNAALTLQRDLRRVVNRVAFLRGL